MRANIETPVFYLDNARMLLSQKAEKEEGYYQSKKYVRMAGHIAYMGVLTAIDSQMPTKKKGRLSVEDYRTFLAGFNRKLLTQFNDLYELLHLSMAYDGILNAKVIQIAIQSAEEFIEKCKSEVLSNKD